MIPCHCRVVHDPEAGRYGDCARAALASILDYENPEYVPHFYHDNDPVAGMERLREFCATQGYAPFFVHYDGAIPLADVLALTGDSNPDGHYLLFGGTPDGDHIVVCKGGAVVHNPSWYGNSIDRPASSGFWSLMILGRL